MDLSCDWATLTQRLRNHEDNSDDDDDHIGDNVSLVSVEGAGRGLRAERDLPGGEVMSNVPRVISRWPELYTAEIFETLCLY